VIKEVNSEESFLKSTTRPGLEIFTISSGNDHLAPYLFCGQTPIDTQNPSSYTPNVKRQYFIKKQVVGNFMDSEKIKEDLNG